MSQSDDKKIEDIASRIAMTMAADVMIFNGEISQQSCLAFTKLCLARKRRENVLLVLVTPGGDPDAAFKIGRILQDKYTKVSVFISGWCKSAGTLVTLAASEVFIGDLGELGPLDIQIAKSDEIAEMGSGLTVDAAMKALEASASKMFINTVFNIRRDTSGMIMTRTASELAATMVTKLLEPIYAQIDPLKIGENSRAMSITKAYGTRLANKSGLLFGPKSLEYLVSSYPDHGFVIDRAEAKALFKSVHEPTPDMVELSEALGDRALLPTNRPGDGKASVTYISNEASAPVRSTDDEQPKSAGEAKSAKPQRQGRNGDVASPSGG